MKKKLIDWETLYGLRDHSHGVRNGFCSNCDEFCEKDKCPIWASLPDCDRDYDCDCEKGHVRGTRLSWMDKDTKFYKRSNGTWLAVEPNGDQWTALTKDSNLWEETD